MSGDTAAAALSGDPMAMAALGIEAAIQAVEPLCQFFVDKCSNRKTSYNPHNGTTTVDSSTEGDSEELKAIDTEPLRRAFETVNYVLRNFGCRIMEAQMLSDAALYRALGNATAHIEVKLFAPDINLLFRSLQARRTDMVLMHSVMASIYFLGALTAELAPSVPNYKDKYPALGPHVITQFFISAIGDDAYSQERAEKEKAFKTLAATAGLLRPTDIGYTTFPGFPSFSPSAYSSRKGSDVRGAKAQFEKLTKHFDKHGFPQPLPNRDVGPINDWRFLSGDTNNRLVEVEKADKHIADNFGRVVYWLICSAGRMPVDRAVIAYHDQHRELVRWLGKRTGFRVLTMADFDMKPKPYAKMDSRLRVVMQPWLIIMAPLVPDQAPPSMLQQPHLPRTAPRQSVAYTTEKIAVQQPQAQDYQHFQPPNPNSGLPYPDPGQPYPDPGQSYPGASQLYPTSPQPYPSASYSPTPANTSYNTYPVTPNAPPAYSPIPITIPNTNMPQQQFTIRRKAPPAPKPISFARALHDFLPEADDQDSLPFRAGEVLEITDKVSHVQDGWWVGKIRGGNGRGGLVPASYLTVEEVASF